MGLLRKALEAAHRDMHVGGEARIGQPRVVDRCKLAVSLVKMLFKPPFDCPPYVRACGEMTLLPGLPPFTAGAFEAHVNQQARHWPVPVKHIYDKGFPESVLKTAEGIALEEGSRGPGSKRCYHLRIRDSNTGKTYKLICVPHPDGAGIILTKVKCNSTRYAVIDIARPARAMDLRVFFRKESRLCSLDGAIQAAFERIASTALIDSVSGWLLHWPCTPDLDLDTTIVTPRSSTMPASTCANWIPPRVPPPTAPPAASPKASRFVLMGVWHIRSWVIAGDRLTWKLNEMNVVMLFQPEGFVTSISVFPNCWGEKMKCYENPEPGPTTSLQPVKSSSSAYSAAACFDSTLQQAPPKWTPESILSECPALIDWLQQRLP
ncbi:unnamed protein product [Closterium sp. Naga37s-1]|nr:unnamed protein product [Closterium sp. Naga37s-1]